jgi:hypothetical protein
MRDLARLGRALAALRVCEVKRPDLAGLRKRHGESDSDPALTVSAPMMRIRTRFDQESDGANAPLDHGPANDGQYAVVAKARLKKVVTRAPAIDHRRIRICPKPQGWSDKRDSARSVIGTDRSYKGTSPTFVIYGGGLRTGLHTSEDERNRQDSRDAPRPEHGGMIRPRKSFG